jgi:hypothetical protein
LRRGIFRCIWNRIVPNALLNVHFVGRHTFFAMVIPALSNVLYATNPQTNVLAMDVPATDTTTQGTLLGIVGIPEMKQDHLDQIIIPIHLLW